MELKCEFKDMNWSHESEDLYTCLITSATITELDTKIASIDGTHHPGKSHKDVLGLKLLNTTVEYFPRRLDQIIPKIKVLAIENCGLKQISMRDLIGLENLEALFFQSGKLQSLPDDLFTHMRKLTRISFYDNELEFLSSKLLLPIVNNGMKCINFNNTVIDLFYGPGYDEPDAIKVDSLRELMYVMDSKCKAPSIDEKVSAYKKVFHDAFLQGFEELWNSGRFSDFVITVDLKEFRVHKSVLAFQSSFFSKIFEKSEKTEMKIENHDAEIVEDLLRFLYTGEVRDETDFIEMFTIAAELEVPFLKFICEDRILQIIDESNAYQILVLANAHESDDMKVVAFNIIKGMFPNFKLADCLINNIERIRQLWDARQNYDSLLKQFNKM